MAFGLAINWRRPHSICLFVIEFPFMKLAKCWKCWNMKLKKKFISSERWIPRLANRWRAQQSAITIVNCRIYWAAITWTQIAVSGIPGTTFAWGSTNQHFMCNITIIVYVIVENWACNWFVYNRLLPQVYSSYANTPMYVDRLCHYCCFVSNNFILTYQNFEITTSDERDCPLNLSISLSGEKENNNDS